MFDPTYPMVSTISHLLFQWTIAFLVMTDKTPKTIQNSPEFGQS